MKKIAVNTRLLLPGRLEGISRFAFEVLSRLVEAHPETEFVFFFDRKYDPQFVFGENVTPVVVPPPARHPVLWYAWFHLQLPRLLRKTGAEVFFSPEWYLAPGARLPQVATFHDLAYEHYPGDILPHQAWYCRRYSPRFAREATALLTVSEFSKQDLMQTYGLPAEKISVVYNGATRRFVPLPTAEQAKVRDQYSNGLPYFHFVGTINPRKNIEHLLRAFDRFRERQNEPVKLLLVGRKGWQYEGAMRTYEQMRFREDVHFTGFVPDEELSRIYAASQGLCYVPFLEGFGIPLVEAMHSETPILCSNVTSLPEVVGEAALLVAPDDEAAIALGMERLLREPPLRQRLIGAGRKQRQRFSWDLTAERVWAVLGKAYHAKSRT
jgi:glycosyltransferase involved in cell wall biosynthesis